MNRNQFLPSFLAVTLFCHLHCSWASVDPPSVSWFKVDAKAKSLLVEDFSGDGLPDVIVRTSVGLMLLRNLGKGRFSRINLSTPNYQDSAVACGDISGDGLPDLAVAHRPLYDTRTYVYCYKNNGNSVFSLWQTIEIRDKNSAHCKALKIADINNDGQKDIVAAFDGSTSDALALVVVKALSPTQFAVPQLSQVPNSPSGHTDTITDLHILDANNDASPDALIAAGNSVTLMHGDGNGLFVSPGAGGFLNLGNDSQDISLGDVSDDGKVDFAVAGAIPTIYGNTGTNARIFIRGETGFASSVNLIGLPGNDFCVAIGDFDGDGKRDVAVGKDSGGSTQPSVEIFQNNGGGFVPPQPSVNSLYLDFPLTNIFQHGAVLDIEAADLNKSGNDALVVWVTNDSIWYEHAIGIIQFPAPTRVVNLTGLLSFGNLPVGGTNQKSLAIKNTGNRPLTISSISYPTGFSGNWNGGTIAPGDSQVVTVTFAPASGQTYSGAIVVESNKTAGGNTILASGTGIAPEIAVQEPLGSDRSSGEAIGFAQTPPGFTSTPTKSITIKNTGTSPLAIAAMDLSGADTMHFALTKPKLPLVLAPKRSTKVTAVFRPSSTGNKSANLVITSNDADEASFVLTFTGTGTPPDFVFSVSQQGLFEALPANVTANGTVKRLSGLPLGMTYLNGRLTGTPRTAGAHRAKATVVRADNKTETREFTIVVEALQPWAVGTFFALINPPGPPDTNLTRLGGCLKVTSAASGALTGTLQLGAKSYSFKGQLVGVLESGRNTDPLTATAAIITNSRDRTQDITLNLEFRPEDHATLPGLTGTLTFQGGDHPMQPGWQQVWNAKSNPAFGNKDRVLNVAIGNADAASGPQGDGFAIVKLTKAGLAKWAGTLSDGRKVTGGFTASPDGDVPFYGAIRYPNGGSLFALLATEPSGDFYKVSDAPRPNGRWIKLPTTNPKKADRLYRDGFDVDLNISGAEFTKPARNEQLFGNIVPPTPLTLQFSGGGIDSATQLGAADPLGLAAELQPRNKLAVTEPNLPVRITPGFSATTGLLGGRISLKDPDLPGGRPVARTLTFNGLYIPDLDNPGSSAIRGFFLLPELPDAAGEAISKTPILSGTLEVIP
jgi:hypothetical protein